MFHTSFLCLKANCRKLQVAKLRGFISNNGLAKKASRAAKGEKQTMEGDIYEKIKCYPPKKPTHLNLRIRNKWVFNF
jgi:hypothetical protein